MANEQNLKRLSSKEARENGSKGGKASVKSRKRKKEIKEQLEYILQLPVTDFFTKNDMSDLGIEEDDMNNQMLLVATLFKKATEGNMRAIDTIIDMVEPQEKNISIQAKSEELKKLLEECKIE